MVAAVSSSFSLFTPISLSGDQSFPLLQVMSMAHICAVEISQFAAILDTIDP
jgi:hypothetical protein